MNQSVIDAELLNIYNRTIHEDTHMLQTYNMVNVAMVVNGIRPGAIIASITEENKESIMKSLQNLGCFVKDIRWKKSGSPILLFVRADDPTQRNRLASMVTALNRNENDPIDPFIKNTASPMNQSNSIIGTLIGYFNALPRQTMTNETKSVGITTTVFVNDTPVSINLFPQKIKVLDTHRKQRLIEMANQIQTLRLPDGFRIDSVTPYFKSNGVQYTLKESVPPKLSGGKRTHTRRRHTKRHVRSRRARR